MKRGLLRGKYVGRSYLVPGQHPAWRQVFAQHLFAPPCFSQGVGQVPPNTGSPQGFFTLFLLWFPSALVPDPIRYLTLYILPGADHCLPHTSLPEHSNLMKLYLPDICIENGSGRAIALLVSLCSWWVTSKAV